MKYIVCCQYVYIENGKYVVHGFIIEQTRNKEEAIRTFERHTINHLVEYGTCTYKNNMYIFGSKIYMYEIKDDTEFVVNNVYNCERELTQLYRSNAQYYNLCINCSTGEIKSPFPLFELDKMEIITKISNEIKTLRTLHPKPAKWYRLKSYYTSDIKDILTKYYH